MNCSRRRVAPVRRRNKIVETKWPQANFIFFTNSALSCLLLHLNTPSALDVNDAAADMDSHEAIKGGDAEIASSLAEDGVPFSDKDESVATSVHIAASERP